MSREASRAAGDLLVWLCAVLAIALALTCPGCSRPGDAIGDVEQIQSDGSVVVWPVWKWSLSATGSDAIAALMQEPRASADVFLLCVSPPRMICAFDAATGDPLWQRAGKRFAMAGSEAVILTGDKLECLECVGSRDGAVRWTRQLDSSWGWPGIAIAGDKVVLAIADRVTCFSLESGEELWTKREAVPDAPSDGLTTAYPIADLIAVVPYKGAGAVVGLRAADGSEVWRYPSPLPVMSLPWYESGLLLLRTDEGVMALDAATGKPRWNTPIPASPVYVYGGKAVAAIGGRAYAVGGLTVTEMDLRTGEIMAESEIPGPLSLLGPSVVAVIDGQLAIVSTYVDDSKSPSVRMGLTLFDPGTGRISWAGYLFQKTVQGGLAVADDRLYFVGYDGIVAIELGEKVAAP